MLSEGFIEKIKKQGVLKVAEKFTEMKKISPVLWVGKCPNPEHNDDTPSFIIKMNPDGFESWACFGCHSGPKGGDNFGSDNIAFVQWMYYHKKHEVLSFKDAVYSLAKFYSIPMEEDKFQKLYDQKAQEEIVYRRNLLRSDIAKKYLYSRGLDDFDFEFWGLGFNSGTNRITFPIKHSSGQTCAFSNRTIEDIKPKYIVTPNSPIFKKGESFFGSDKLNRERKYILITEGQFDVILAHKFGIDFAVATLGCSLGEKLAERIKKSNKIPILCYDGDDAGKRGIQAALKNLETAGVNNSKVMVLPQGLDLADLALSLKGNLPKYVCKHIMSYSGYLLSGIADHLDSVVNDEIKKAIPEIKRAIDSIDNTNEKLAAKSYIRNRLHLWLN